MKSVLTNDDVTHGVWNGDCLKLLPALPEDNDAWLKPAFAELYRVLKPDN